MKTNWDSRLQTTARKLIEADRARRPLVPVLKRACPEIHKQLLKDANCPKLLSLWARSQNVDEHAREEIVHPAILRLIGDITGVDMLGNVVHAGLQHTYGYLFSQIETPYGMKRDRWVEPDLEQGFGIKTPSLRPIPAQGTLLANVTYFLGRVAFRGMRREIGALRGQKNHVADTLVAYDYRSLQRRRITETVSIPDTSDRKRRVVIHTDLVPYPIDVVSSADSHLLIYTIVDGSDERARLVTGFPVSQGVFDELVDQPIGRRVAISARFNSYVEGMTDKHLIGSRTILS